MNFYYHARTLSCFMVLNRMAEAHVQVEELGKRFFLPIAAQKGHLLAGTSGRCLGDFCLETDVFPSMRARPTARRLLDEPP